ncbi:MFS transporter [Sphingosinicella ginsenosidimutans]|uniref:MFS transporter n=1 Tax=Allosphingosinicella ginsenosidimutans TaxID=1176539 RepID=A0A5C6TP91_9SPHN|nr:MFS transporter [Sphingosinicella ginsenosidimutans]TXC62382.1 MFS transporter [Sphingosinicella ginsenosidimutans]
MSLRSGAMVQEAAEAGFEGQTQWRMIVALTMIFSISSIDRNIISLLVEPIRHDLGLTDVQMSLLLGFSFVFLFTVCAFPAGYLADRMSRRLLIAIASIFWSIMGLVCALATGFWQLFLGRLGLGAGEAALPPSAFALMRDGIRPEHRARAFGIYYMSPILGRGLGNWGGALILSLAAAGTFAGVPLLGRLHPWQIAIATPALIGIPLAALLFTFREPKRQERTPQRGAATFGELFRHIGANRRVYLLIYGAMFLAQIGNGWNQWLPAAIGRTWHLTPGEIGRVLGPIALVTGPVVLFSLGYIMDRLGKKSPDAVMRVAFIGTALHILPTLFILLAPSIPVMWGSVFFSLLFDGGVLIATSAALSFVTPTRLMGKATAFYAVATNTGSAIGPTIFALVGKYFFTGPLALPSAMLACYPVIMIASMVALWFGGRELLRRAAVEAEAANG